MPARTVREIVDDLLLTRGAFSSGDLARAAGVSRQAVHRHLKAMIARGELAAEGKGRAARYVSPVETFGGAYLGGA